MRRNDLSIANFICTFGEDEVLLDFAKEIVLPAFLRDTLVRTYGDTSYYVYEGRLVSLGDRDGVPELAIIGRFVKDTILKREQIVQRGRLVEDHHEMPSAPSCFFVLLLTDHRLLYFAETQQAPELNTFESTIQIFLRRVWREFLQAKHESGDGVTYKELQRQFPMPRLNVVPVAREESIAETIKSFAKVKTIKFRLIKPNDEPDSAEVLDSVRKKYAPLSPERLDVEIADAGGLDVEGSVAAVQEASKGLNTDITVTGENKDGLRAKADNDVFALKVPVEEPPTDELQLAERLRDEFAQQVAVGSVHRAPLTEKIRNAIQALGSLL